MEALSDSCRLASPGPGELRHSRSPRRGIFRKKSIGKRREENREIWAGSLACHATFVDLPRLTRCVNPNDVESCETREDHFCPRSCRAARDAVLRLVRGRPRIESRIAVTSHTARGRGTDNAGLAGSRDSVASNHWLPIVDSYFNTRNAIINRYRPVLCQRQTLVRTPLMTNVGRGLAGRALPQTFQ